MDALGRMRGYTNAQRVEAFIERITMSGCWIWMRSLGPTGYGQAWNGDTMEGAHRVSFRTFVGPIPDDLDVLHHCDVRCCVNPEHLYLGTHQQNMDDKMRRGRMKPLPGVLNGVCKLTDEQVEQVKTIYATGLYLQADVAAMFGCSQQLVSRITRLEHRN